MTLGVCVVAELRNLNGATLTLSFQRIPPGDVDARRRHRVAALVAKLLFAAVGALHVFEREQELAPPDSPSELSIGDRVQSRVLLQPDDLPDRFILRACATPRWPCGPKLWSRSAVRAAARAPSSETQAAQAADMVGTEGRGGSHRPRILSAFLCMIFSITASE